MRNAFRLAERTNWLLRSRLYIFLPGFDGDIAEFDFAEATQEDDADFGIGDERDVVVDGEAADVAGVGVVFGA